MNLRSQGPLALMLLTSEKEGERAGRRRGDEEGLSDCRLCGAPWKQALCPRPGSLGTTCQGCAPVILGESQFPPQDRFTLRKTEVGKATPPFLSFLKPYGPKQELLLPQQAGLD